MGGSANRGKRRSTQASVGLDRVVPMVTFSSAPGTRRRRKRKREPLNRRGGQRMIITQTPLRISFLGGGTDYPEYFLKHSGAVLGTAVDKSAVFCMSHF